MLFQNSEAFHSHPLDRPRGNVGTGGDVGPRGGVGPTGDISPRHHVILGGVLIGLGRHYKRHAFCGCYGWGFE